MSLLMSLTLLEQIKKRRLILGFKQADMMLRMGISRQQYQHLESKGNPRLKTLELIAQGLNSELMLIPKEQLRAVQALLSNQTHDKEQKKDLSEDPWKNLLGNDEG